MKKCVLCSNVMPEEFGKMKGTIIKVRNEKGERQFIRVCSECQKQDDWINKAKIKGA